KAAGPGTLLHLRLDVDTRVLASVLDNRYTTEPDVIQATIQARATPESLECIAGHPRWGSRPTIRSALLRHPELSPAVALTLLTRASLDDLRGVRDSERASPLVRACAERVLAERQIED